jgi:hypothetical protein
MHKWTGFTDEIGAELAGMYKSFFRQISKHPFCSGTANINNNIGEGNSEEAGAFKEGKELMLVELYKAICGWLLSYKTADSIFAYCYLVLTWNLACRAGNTSQILYCDACWKEAFNSFSICFLHSKTDQLREEAKYPQHLFCNPLTPFVCPLVSLAIYLMYCFSTAQNSEGPLFPGVGQDARFPNLLSKVIYKSRESVKAMGYALEDIGTHSICKGAVTYLASLAGGPPVAATCIHEGWTIG